MTDKDERISQARYWSAQSERTSVEQMMLDTRATELDHHERPEILSKLGSVAGKSVLELGAGIGRFTGELAKEANQVIACDFMKHLTLKNKQLHGHFGNITFITEDVTLLNQERQSSDIVFANWLLMYLSDDEIEQLLIRILNWLKEGGVFFFRESCYYQSGDVKRDVNPSHYRHTIDYFKIIDRIISQSEDGTYYKFKLVHCGNIAAYARIKKNYGQIYWKLVKTVKEPEQIEQRQFLDNVQYTRNGILRYEKLFGHGFISTGGSDTTVELVRKLDLKPHEFVLDVGCGIGGGDVYLAKEFGVDVLGVDLSVNAIAIALERMINGEYTIPKGNLTFEIADCTTRDFNAASFDIIYSRDTILHIHDKPSLFKRLFGCLKPRGRLLITDYCCAKCEWSEGFKAYVKQRGYDLHSVENYGKMLEEAGFVDVEAIDATQSIFLPSLVRELKKAEEGRESFLREFTVQDYNAVVNGWKDKIERVHAGEQRWGVFYAKKT